MKKLLFLITITLLLSLDSKGQFGSRRMRGIEVEETGFSVNVDTTTLFTKSIDIGDIKIQIIPLDPSKLDDQFYNQFNLNGQFSYSYYDASREKYFFQRIKKRIYKFKTDSEYIVEGAKWLVNNDIISEEIYNKIYQELVSENDSTGTEVLGTNKSAYNPYNLGDKYLNTFRLDITNKTNTVQQLDAIFQLVTNNTSLTSLSNSQILGFQKDGAKIADIEALERYNYSKNIFIPPNSELKKYIAFLPININNGNVELFVTSEGKTQKLDWNFNINKQYFNEKYFYYALEVSNDQYPDYAFYNVSGVSDAYIDDDILYINKEDINKPIKIFCYCKSSSFDNLYYGTIDIKAIDYLDLNRNRRSEIKLGLEKIEEVKKRR